MQEGTINRLKILASRGNPEARKALNNLPVPILTGNGTPSEVYQRDPSQTTQTLVSSPQTTESPFKPLTLAPSSTLPAVTAPISL